MCRLIRDVFVFWAFLSLVMTMSCAEQATQGVLPGGPPPSPEIPDSSDLKLTEAERPEGRAELILAIAAPVGADVAARRMEPVADYVTELLGMKVSLIIAPKYVDLIEFTEKKSIDVVVFPPLTFVLAQERVPSLRPLISQVTNGVISYSSFIVVKATDKARTIDDLRGRKMAFVGRRSTSGFLYPYASFLDANIDPERDLEVVYVSDHQTAFRKLALGTVDAVATGSGMRDTLDRFTTKPVVRTPSCEGPECAGKETKEVPSVDLGRARFRILHNAGRIPFDVLAVLEHVPAAGAEKIMRAFMQVDARSPRGRSIWRKNRKISGWIPFDDNRYEAVRQVLARVRAHRKEEGGL